MKPLEQYPGFLNTLYSSTMTQVGWNHIQGLSVTYDKCNSHAVMRNRVFLFTLCRQSSHFFCSQGSVILTQKIKENNSSETQNAVEVGSSRLTTLETDQNFIALNFLVKDRVWAVVENVTLCCSVKDQYLHASVGVCWDLQFAAGGVAHSDRIMSSS